MVCAQIWGKCIGNDGRADHSKLLLSARIPWKDCMLVLEDGEL